MKLYIVQYFCGISEDVSSIWTSEDDAVREVARLKQLGDPNWGYDEVEANKSEAWPCAVRESACRKHYA